MLNLKDYPIKQNEVQTKEIQAVLKGSDKNDVFVPEDFKDFIYVTDGKNIKVNNARKM